jgi:hypothetical protein
MEDVDAAFPESLIASRTATIQSSSLKRFNTPKKYAQSQVTFSGLLNVLDGITARYDIYQLYVLWDFMHGWFSEDRIIFMTTNYLDQLDPALIRPGRIDRVQFIGHATDYQVRSPSPSTFLLLVNSNLTYMLLNRSSNYFVCFIQLRQVKQKQRNLSNHFE